MQSCEGVIHLAGQFSLWPQDYPRLYRANVVGTENMLAEAMDAGRPRFVFVNTAGTLGISETAVVRDETAPYNLDALNAPYHQTKLLAEQRVLAAAAQGLPAVAVNPTLVIGPHDYGLRNPLFRQILRTPAVFYTRGGGNVVLVDDVVAGIVAALERGQPGERYMLGGDNLTYYDQFDLIASMAGRPRPRYGLGPGLLRPVAAMAAVVNRVVPLPSFVSPQFAAISSMWAYYSSAKAERELGYRRTPFGEAVHVTLEWYRKEGYVR